MAVHTFKAEAGGSLWVQAQPGIYNEFQASQGYTVRPCLNQGIKDWKRNDSDTKNKTSNNKIYFMLLAEEFSYSITR